MIANTLAGNGTLESKCQRLIEAAREVAHYEPLSAPIRCGHAATLRLGRYPSKCYNFRVRR